MSVEHGSSTNIRKSPEHGTGLSDVRQAAEAILDTVLDGEQPNGIAFTEVAIADSPTGHAILNQICELTGENPQSAEEIAALFNFRSSDEVEEFFRLLDTKHS